jgi:hypothetical protein
MKNVLVLTDFSNPAYAALFYISGLFRNKEVSFLILNTFPEATTADTPGGKSRAGRLEDKAWEGLTRTEHRIRLDKPNPKHTFRTQAIAGNLSNAVLSVLEQGETDLIVMGNKGASHKKGIFMGSNVIRILNAVNNCAVLAVPEEATQDRPQEIAFASAFNTDYRPESLRLLLEIATMCSAAIRVVHINEEERLSEAQMENLNGLMSFMGNTAHTLHWIPDFRTKAGALHSFISEKGIGMLVMVHQKHGFLDTLLGEPVIRKIQFMVNVPLLVLPERK